MIHRNRYLYTFFCLLVFFALPHCDATSSKPEDLIQEDVYIELLTEFQLLKSLSVIQGPAHIDSLEQAIFTTYEVTEDQFLRSHHYYQEQFEEQIKRIDKVIENVKEEQGKSNPPKEADDN